MKRNKTMKTNIFAAAAFSLLAAATAASAVTPGAAQLAATLGVQPGVYSASELAQLAQYQRENDATGVSFILSRASSATSADSAGLRQFALSLGVEPGKYSASELSLIKDAIRDNDTATVQLIKANAGGAANDSNAKAPLAAYLGVNADDFTRLQLVELVNAAQPDN